ncbi:MAG: hypothetical protein WCG80_07845 [Spirochaetales bacterium]
MKISIKGLLVATVLLLAALPMTAQTAPVYLVFQNFEAGDGLAAAQGSTAVIEASGFVDKSTKSAKLSFDTSGDPHENLQNVVVTSSDGKAVDASAYKYLEFWLKDTQGSNTHMVSVLDAAGHIYTGWDDVKSQKDKWVLIYFPLKTLTEKGVDVKSIKEIRVGEWNAGTYFMDDFIFTSDFKAAKYLK